MSYSGDVAGATLRAWGCKCSSPKTIALVNTYSQQPLQEGTYGESSQAFQVHTRLGSFFVISGNDYLPHAALRWMPTLARCVGLMGPTIKC